MENKKMSIYFNFIILSILLFVISITILESTKFIAPICLTISIYFFAGALIKLCKMNNKLKNTVICVIDLLFWLP